jgi:transposase
MLKKEDYLMIKALKRRGVYQKDIAAELGVHPRTVSRALKRGSAPAETRAKRGSKLDPYKGQVNRLLAEGVWNAVVILREIQAEGYAGGITILRDYIRPNRMQRQNNATVRFETPPGRQLQTDWGELVTEIAGAETKVCFIVNTLSYSRRFHFWCTDSMDAEHTYEGLIRSFEYFGGVTEEVVVDNQKTAVMLHPAGAAAHFNPRFVDLAGYYGFAPWACQPYRARTKGKDERMVGYLKQHFFVRYRSFESWEHLNQLAEQWLRAEADERVHGTVKEVVRVRFERETPALQPLPAVRYDTSYIERRQVGWDAYIDVRGNRYSVPDYLAGQAVVVRIGLDGSLKVYADDQLVAQHYLRAAAEGWVTVPDHHQQLWDDTLKVHHRSLQVYEAML